MFCKNCGAQIPDSAKFCTECGRKIEQVPVRENPQRPKPKPHPIPWWGWVLLALGIVISISSAFQSGVIEPSPESRVTVENPIDVEYSGCHIKAKSFDIVGTSKPTLYVYYEFTNFNDTEVPYCFADLVTQRAFQDNIEIDVNYPGSDTGRDAYTKIKPGASLTVCTRFDLRNSNSGSKVEITMRSLTLLFSEDLGTMVFNFK